MKKKIFLVFLLLSFSLQTVVYAGGFEAKARFNTAPSGFTIKLVVYDQKTGNLIKQKTVKGDFSCIILGLPYKKYKVEIYYNNKLVHTENSIYPGRDSGVRSVIYFYR